MISSMSYFVQNRKGKLATYLNNNTDELSLEKQHQLYGAIRELDFITNILHSYRQEEITNAKNPDEIFLFRPIKEKGFLKEIITLIKDLF
jgi:hypothetical protein